MLVPVRSSCSTPAGTNLLAFHTFPAVPAPPQLPPPPTKKKKKRPPRPLLRGNHSSVGLSAPRSLISCGTTSESACRAAITKALGALGRRKMDLEGICGQSSTSLLCILHWSRFPSLPRPAPPPQPSPPPSPLLPSIYLFCQTQCWMAVKRYKLSGGVSHIQ